jgi:hypothetical protein
VIEKEPAAVARFLLETSNLSKTAIGEYLGDHSEFNLNVRLIPLSSRNNTEREGEVERGRERGRRTMRPLSLPPSLSFTHTLSFFL